VGPGEVPLPEIIPPVTRPEPGIGPGPGITPEIIPGLEEVPSIITPPEIIRTPGPVGPTEIGVPEVKPATGSLMEPIYSLPTFTRLETTKVAETGRPPWRFDRGSTTGTGRGWTQKQGAKPFSLSWPGMYLYFPTTPFEQAVQAEKGGPGLYRRVSRLRKGKKEPRRYIPEVKRVAV
jgi:hypothetical protein